jgi:membrane associated rhomboid family serine protease
MLFLPYTIDTVTEKLPFTNWIIIALCVLMFAFECVSPPSDWMMFVLDGWSLSGLVGHMFLHGGIFHLAGNMLFLWVFGNTVCGNSGNVIYGALYLFYGIMAASAHVIVTGAPAVGASGAINGVVGMAVAMYPLNRVGVFYWILIRFGTFRMPLWVLAFIWFLFDVRGAFTNAEDVAYWAHIGGFLAGLCAGMIAIEKNWIVLSAYDNESLLDILLRRPRAR